MSNTHFAIAIHALTLLALDKNKPLPATQIRRTFSGYPSFIVNEMKGDSESGSIGLWVDIGTAGYFKDLKIIAK